MLRRSSDKYRNQRYVKKLQKQKRLEEDVPRAVNKNLIYDKDWVDSMAMRRGEVIPDEALIQSQWREENTFSQSSHGTSFYYHQFL